MTFQRVRPIARTVTLVNRLFRGNRGGRSGVKAIMIHRYGGPEEMGLEDADILDIGPEDALIRVEFAGVSFIDVYMRNGLCSRSDTYAQSLPLGLGMEGGGVVEAIGSMVSNVAPGDRAAWCIERGSYAELARVPAWKLVKVPDDVPMNTAAALQLQGSTSHYLTTALCTKSGSPDFGEIATGLELCGLASHSI